MQFLLGIILKLFGADFGNNFLKTASEGLLKAQRQRLDAANEAERIAADQNIAFWKAEIEYAREANRQGTKRQSLKMNNVVFWFILGVALFPGLGTFILLSVYNVLWWSGGIWPQAWGIAAFPPPYDAWAQMSIEWVFDPVKLAMTTGVAAVGGYVTGKRK